MLSREAAFYLDPDLTSVPCTLSWSRVSPWLPWMRMGQRPGGLVFHTRGVKSSYDAVPEQIRDRIAATRPEFAEPPAAWSTPNETSWTAFARKGSRPSG